MSANYSIYTVPFALGSRHNDLSPCCYGLPGSSGKYCIFLSIAFILAVITVIIGFVASAFIVSTVDAVFRNHLLFYHKMGSSKSFIDHVQKENKCCGYNNHEDWWISEVPEFTVNNGLLPSTCCEPHAENMCQFHGIQSRKVFTQGCKHFVETTTNLYLIAIMASITAIALLTFHNLKQWKDVSVSEVPPDQCFHTLHPTHVGNIVTSAIIVAVAIFGLLGAIMKNSCLLIIYCIVLACTLVICIIFIVATLFFGSVLSSIVVQASFPQMIKNYKDPGTKKTIDDFQKKYLCCGYESFEDFWIDELSPEFTRKNNYLPKSCCGSSVRTCQHLDSTLFSKPCKPFVDQSMAKVVPWAFYLIAIVFGIIALSVLISLILASILTSKIRSGYGMA
ncbi:hypothetical protein HELRODRAFT_189291 [Helobdella robusta]|uniref:Tetraspanin n=1 Tax=Helobdella robusta TaxID=6412 RepID=T1FQX4_HELRO|nr:hypothetical protein HELRODRAFT_189291 [Helobdella robusta]ESN96564.1 hypothetical protein HELRODRAFT_189291 [Helobdella robusta]